MAETIKRRVLLAAGGAATVVVPRAARAVDRPLKPSVMWGQFSHPAGYRTRLTNLIQSSFPIFWNVTLAAA